MAHLQIPDIECPEDFEVNIDPASATATVNLPDPETLSDNSGLDVTLAGNIPGQRILPIGQTIVTYTATDFYGNSAECSFTITVKDLENPVIECPENFEVNTDASSATATVNLPDPETLSDNSGLDVTLAGNIPGQRILPIGQTIVTYTATDFYGNTAQCSFTITVTDTDAPTLICPGDLLVMVSSSSAIVQRPDPGYLNDNSGNVMLNHNWPADNQFDEGSTQIMYTATDGAGNEVSCTFNVVVEVVLLFAVNCPGHISTSTDPGQPTASVTWPNPTIVNNPGGTVTITDDAPAGNVFNIGVTTVTVTATVTGAQATCMFTVTVNDNEDPALQCPNDIVAPTGEGLATATLQEPNPLGVGDNSQGVVTVDSNWPAGSVFPIGATIIAMSAVDPSGNQALCTYTVTIEDREDPQVTCPTDVFTRAYDPAVEGSMPYWPLDLFETSDNSMMEVTLRIDPESGSILSGLGDHTITVTAIDSSLNEASCTFIVTINDPAVSTEVQITLDIPFIPAYNDLDSPESQALIEDIVTQMDRTMTNSELVDCYGGSRVPQLMDGSVVVVITIIWRDPDVPVVLVLFILDGEIEINMGNFADYPIMGNPSISAAVTVVIPDRTPPTLQCPNDTTTDSNNAVISVIPDPVFLDDNSNGDTTFTCDWPRMIHSRLV
ncbi:hyalin-like [Amphiura filiformis]|uniref:hyalin-like n=1 Tax=Amphiura filiformis TaxID=82378 RepID=UPI003B20B638